MALLDCSAVAVHQTGETPLLYQRPADVPGSNTTACFSVIGHTMEQV